MKYDTNDVVIGLKTCQPLSSQAHVDSLDHSDRYFKIVDKFLIYGKFLSGLDVGISHILRRIQV